MRELQWIEFFILFGTIKGPFISLITVTYVVNYSRVRSLDEPGNVIESSVT